MIKIPRQKLAVSLLPLPLAIGLLAVPSQAETSLEEVLVTAQKRTENLQDVPISITAYTEESLNILRIENVADLGPTTPGLVTAPAAGIASGTRIWIRGIGSAQVSIGIDPRVALYTDGVYLGKTPGLAFDALEMERIEVLKGPQGTLYGRNAVGGAINLISRKASTESFSGKLKVGAGNYNLEEANGYINVPLSQSVAVKLSGMTRSRDGWVENKGPGPDFNGRDAEAWRADLRWEPLSTLSFDVAYEKNEADLEPQYSQSVFGDGTIGPGLGSLINPPETNDRLDKVTTAYALEKSHLDLEAYSVFAGWDFADQHSVRLIGSYRKADATDSRGFWPETDGSLLPWTDRIVSTTGQNHVLNDHKQYSLELNFEGKIADGLDYTAGLFYFNEDTGAGEDYTLTKDLVDFFSPSAVRSAGRIETDAYAVFGTLNWTPGAFGERLHVTVGGRYSEDKREGKVKTFVNQGPLPDFSALVFTYDTATGLPFSDNRESNTWDNFDPQIILQYDLNDNANVYASYSTAYRSGGYNTDATTLEGFTFDKEDMEAFELGYKSELMNGRLRLNMAVFYYDQSNIQVTEQDPAHPVRQNVFNTDGDSKGFEIEATAQLINDLTASLGYAYLDAQQDSYEAVFRPGTPDEVTVVNEGGSSGAPENSVFANFNYRRDVSWGELMANLNYSYTDSYDVTPGTELMSVSLLDARIATRWDMGDSGALTLAVWGKNLLDDEYHLDRINFSEIDGFNAPDVAWFGDPLTYGVELSYEF
ncbi:TonB-dependent receptor [Seongchinamella unica]|uniref:TonB-dependent receptor n=1 Tax=Seongchinamella unica TaxID=2547392 RepID=A0A4R5LMZ1_9GAMM|nr:TonB-dependent receptor [Seongchinamella unica]TDG11314.1 TonB-dependent receptor [Seongchinamella unica]